MTMAKRDTTRRTAPLRAVLPVLALLLPAPAGSAPAETVGEAASPRIVVTTTLLQTGVRDLLGDAAEVESMMPPGSCPGHFDITPSAARMVREADVILRHAFQRHLAAGLSEAGEASRVEAIESSGTLTIPRHYLEFCRRIGTVLVRRGILSTEALAAATRALEKRAEEWAPALRRERARLAGTPVIAAGMQKDFSRWLGLEVAGTYPPAAATSAAALRTSVEQARAADVRAVIGNLQWGERPSRAVSEAVGAPVVMLSNFPDTGAAGAYWALLERNLDAVRNGIP